MFTIMVRIENFKVISRILFTKTFLQASWLMIISLVSPLPRKSSVAMDLHLAGVYPTRFSQSECVSFYLPRSHEATVDPSSSPAMQANFEKHDFTLTDLATPWRARQAVCFCCTFPTHRSCRIHRLPEAGKLRRMQQSR